MRNRRLLVLFLVSMNWLNPTAKGQNGQLTPKLFIGGGALSEEMYLAFCELAGANAKLVVIPTASSKAIDEERIKKRWYSRGIKEVSIVHTTDRTMADNDDFLIAIQHANAVWISGGSQYRIADAYLETRVEKELYNLVQRGGIIGGSSAGAAIQSKVMIRGGKTEPTIATGFDLLPGAIIDQHFLKRNRLSRLIAAVRIHPNLIGFGIDEDTAILVNGKEYSVIGKSYVLRMEMVDDTIQVNAFENGDIIPTQSNQ